MEWIDVAQGDFALVKCFARDRVTALCPFQVVNLMGFEASASYSTKYSKYLTDLKCQAPVTGFPRTQTSTFRVRRSTFCVLRSEFSVLRSPFCVLSLGAQESSIG